MDDVDWIDVEVINTDDKQSNEDQEMLMENHVTSVVTKTSTENVDSSEESPSVNSEFVIYEIKPKTSAPYHPQLSLVHDLENHHSPTSSTPSTISLTGQYNFRATFFPIHYKSWDYSEELKKLYTDMNKLVQVTFSLSSYPESGLYIRALPLYGDAGDLKIPVKRCPNHARPDDPTNAGFAFPEHLIRFDNPNAMYCEDFESGRLSVVVPLGQNQAGTSSVPMFMKFMCLGSDVGGINRRPLRVVFTLEDEESHVLGRQVVEVRICCCPKRDKSSDEERFTKSHDKKAKETCSTDQILLVPVHKDDFKKINEFAESAWICREPRIREEIIKTRQTLLKKVMLDLLTLNDINNSMFQHNSLFIKTTERRK